MELSMLAVIGVGVLAFMLLLHSRELRKQRVRVHNLMEISVLQTLALSSLEAALQTYQSGVQEPECGLEERELPEKS